ncbi:MAG: SGNH/GDSL hydrolase family protein [Candidatus Ornithomonoglobus sp.]
MKYTAGWGCAMQQYEPQDMPETLLSGCVIRQKIRMAAGGDSIRITLSNYYGASELEIAALNIAKALDGSEIDMGTDTHVTFGGSGSVVIPAGGRAVSDEIAFKAAVLERLMLTIKTGRVPEKLTGHSGARTTSYISKNADVSDKRINADEENEHWYFISGVDVFAAEDYGVIACLGDSITNGRGVTINADNRWTDVLLERVIAAGMKLSVINDGIGGNALNGYGLGECGRIRYENEVRRRRGLKYVILLEGINDIGAQKADVFRGPARFRPDDGKITTGVIDAYREIIRKAHEQGLKIFGGTITPCGGNTGAMGNYYNETSEAMRQRLNEWIRRSGEFDAVIDFDAVVRDSAEPRRLQKRFDCGDGLHLNPLGYRAMGECIDLGLFK